MAIYDEIFSLVDVNPVAIGKPLELSLQNYDKLFVAIGNPEI